MWNLLSDRQANLCSTMPFGLSGSSDSSVTLASTPGRIFAFTSDLAKIRPGIDCMLENVPPSLVNRAQEVSLAF